MSASAFHNPLLSGLLGDDEIAPFLAAEAELSEALAFEQALLIAQEQEGVIPAGTGNTVLPAIKAFKPNLAEIREGAARDGVIGVELVRQLKRSVGAPGEQYVHLGATSQDLVDTALVLRLVPILWIFERRLGALVTALHDLDHRFGAETLMGRTRMQDALPITVNDRLASWRGPLERNIDRLIALRPRLLVLQFGGAAGSLDKLGEKGPAVARRLAAALELGLPSSAWHSQRDNIVELAGWLALVTGSLGKIGADIGLMAQNSIGEIVIAGGGSSSAMAHKSNPIGAEVLVALAHANAASVGGMNQAMVHEQERSGAAWTLEWLLLPQMLMSTGAGLRTAISLLGQITRMGKPG